jgi:membrane protein
MLEKIKQYFVYGLWDFPLSQEKGIRHFWIKWLRIAYLSARGFVQDKCSLSASSLTYYTLMSIVPILAMAFAIARGFGYHEVLKNQILTRFENQNIPLIEAFKYAEAFLVEARGGVIAGFGLALLFLTVILLLKTLEEILNAIWKVNRHRSLRRMLGDYFALMLIAPILFIIANSTAIFVVNRLENIIQLMALPTPAMKWLFFLVNLIPYFLFWMFFTFIYHFIPNTKVHFASASVAGFFTGCAYVVVQLIYFFFQIGVNRYGAIYGSMAALPLFLVWIQMSWFLLLFGAEISYAHQTLEEHEFEAKADRVSYSFKRLITLWIVHLALTKKFLTLDLLVKRYQIPARLVNPILDQLVVCEILHEARGGYIPDISAREMRISDVINTLESKGENEFPFIEANALAPFEKALLSFSKQIESSSQNIRLGHVSNTI